MVWGLLPLFPSLVLDIVSIAFLNPPFITLEIQKLGEIMWK
jgi:hypothetical protein